MKIGLVSPYDSTWPGGVISHISHLARQFTLMGHQVKILAPHSPSREEAKDGSYISLGRSVPVPYGGSVARISLSVWLYRQVRSVLEREDFDVVHVHEPLAPLLPLYALQFSRALNVGTFHAYYSSPRRYILTHPMLRHWFQKLHGHIAIAPHVSSQMSRFFPADYRIIPNGVDVDSFCQGAPPFPHLKDGKLNILFVGRLEKRKGLRYLLEAYGRLKWDFSDLRLIVVGPGPLDADCWRVLSERNLQDIVFVGTVPGNDLPRYYASADIFCAPATGRESFGVVLLEAMASGTPIVATQIPGYSAVVNYGQGALLVPPKSGEALAEAIASLLKDPQRRQQMAAAGMRAVSRYRWETVAGQVMDYYHSLLEERNGATR